MKDILYSFYTTTAGISNALIFLDEKRNIINNLDFYNYNPWKADWIYTKNYKNERKKEGKRLFVADFFVFLQANCLVR